MDCSREWRPGGSERKAAFPGHAVPYRRHVPGPLRFPLAARSAVLAWYDERGRNLPFRGTTDPYAVLVSEAMAQQTQAARAGEAWLRFMQRFPTVRALAAATPAEVLREWRGLGYNRRAVNLWRAARQIVEEHGGLVPADLRSLQALPGVGPYTARAVAAIAFGLPFGAVDTNIRRVLGRFLAGVDSPMAAADLQAEADAAVPPDRAGDWTHALMDLGATVCRAQRPDCDGCPARPWCGFAGLAPGSARPRAGTREARPSFPGTSRWLRGRIVDRLRAASDGAWTVVAGPIGAHDEAAVSTALEALARDGLIELQQPGPGGHGSRPGSRAARARLPIA